MVLLDIEVKVFEYFPIELLSPKAKSHMVYFPKVPFSPTITVILNSSFIIGFLNDTEFLVSSKVISLYPSCVIILPLPIAVCFKNTCAVSNVSLSSLNSDSKLVLPVLKITPMVSSL